MSVDEGAAQGRVLFLITVKEERREDFLKAYEQIRHLVAEGVPGHVRDQVCQSSTDPEQVADHQRVALAGRLRRLGADRGAPGPGAPDARVLQRREVHPLPHQGRDLAGHPEGRPFHSYHRGVRS